MGNLEYRTMRLRLRGDDPETDFGMIGHGVTGCDIECPRGDPGALLANPGARLLAKEGGPKGDRY